MCVSRTWQALQDAAGSSLLGQQTTNALSRRILNWFMKKMHGSFSFQVCFRKYCIILIPGQTIPMVELKKFN